MLKPGTIVRIKTLNEIIADHPEVQMKNAIQKWQNRICVIQWFKAIVPLNSESNQAQFQYKLSLLEKSVNPADDTFRRNPIESLLWFDYEIELYDQPDVQEDAYMCLIGGTG